MVENAGELLWRARLAGELVPRTALGAIGSVADAYREQFGQIALSGMEVVGWKLGATSEASLKLLGFTEPFVGHVLDRFVYESGDTVPIFPAHAPNLETEFAVRLAADLPPRPEPYGRDDIDRAVASICPSFEIVAFRMEGGFAGAESLVIADSGANAAIVLGSPVTEWSQFDLTKHTLRVSVNNKHVAEGSNEILVWHHTMDAVVWLANHHEMAERGLRGGDVIMTGTCAGLIPIRPADEASADFGEIGSVTAHFVEASPLA